MSTVHSCVEGSNLAVVEVILDEDDQPVMPHPKSPGPRVRVYDTDKSVILETYANVDAQEPGAWRADLTIPKMNLRDRADLRCVWYMKSDEGETYRSTHVIQVSPQSEERTGDVVAIYSRDMTLTVVLPFGFDKGTQATKGDPVNGVPAKKGRPGDSLTFSIYRNNQALMVNLPWTDPTVQLDTTSEQTQVRIPNVCGLPKLEPILLLVDHVRAGSFTPTQYSFKVWIITPQILVAANSLEQFINKARLSNVIPELDYTQTDLLEYLTRGLNLFNSFPPQLTAFNGTNMQGLILDAWLQCSAYYALAAQLQAEGALAFDFSGESVALNVDRTPAIEAALGRVESSLNDHVKPAKKLLAKAGVNSGDGSQGGRFIDGSSNLGALSVTNAPTTRLPWSGRGPVWSRGLL